MASSQYQTFNLAEWVLAAGECLQPQEGDPPAADRHLINFVIAGETTQGRHVKLSFEDDVASVGNQFSTMRDIDSVFIVAANLDYFIGTLSLITTPQVNMQIRKSMHISVYAWDPSMKKVHQRLTSS